MRITLFAGLTQLDPTDPLSTDDFSFQAINPDIIDRLLEVGAITHRHDAHDALADPIAPPDASAFTSGGVIPGGVTLEFAYTLLDADRGETLPSPVDAVTTDTGLIEPQTALTADADYTAGTLAADTYYYGRTWVDAGGGETILGAITAVDVDPGHTNARVLLDDLDTGMIAAGAVAWRLYRARGGEHFHYLASGAGATLTDDGSLCPGCQTFPPEVGTTSGLNRIEVDIPALPGSAVGYRLYGTATSGRFDAFSYIASGTAAGTVTLTQFVPTYGRPPSRSLAIRGASQIDPDTEILDWHWKRPVANAAALPASDNEDGDVRIAKAEKSLYLWISPNWNLLAGTGSATPAREHGHTFTIMGDVVQASGVGKIPGFFVVAESGAAVAVKKIRSVLGVGSATVELRRNSAQLSGYTGLPVTGVPTDASNTRTLADDDKIELVITAVSGNPQNLSVTLDMEIDPP